MANNEQPSRFPTISKNMPITIHASMLVALVILVWAVSRKVSEFESELDLLKRKANYRWSSQMEADVWDEYFYNKDKKPDLDRIRSRYNFFLNDE